MMASMSRRFHASHQPRASTHAASSVHSCMGPPNNRSSLDYDLRRSAAGAALELVAHAFSNRAIGLGVLPVGLGRDHWQPCIRLLADDHVQRHFTEERHPEPLRLVACAAVTENVGARAALRALEVTHVL